jgi:alpha-1,3-rhamnosyl/mannosyltransferase
MDIGALSTEDVELPEGVRSIPIRRRFSNRLNYYEQSIVLPFDIRRAAPDVFHSPGTDPPRWCGVPWVQTLLDVTPIAFRHPKFRGERRRWRGRAKRMLRASAVIAISRHSADDGIRHLGLEPERVHVVPLGVDPSFFASDMPRIEPDPPYLLYVSEYGPHTGFREAFELIARLHDAGFPHRLKMVGKMGPRAEMLVQALVQQSGRPDRVDLLNWVSAAELRRLYRGASMLVMTSRYEGFGLPVLEAMASGTPVVSFDNSSLPEVVGDAGVLVPDGDVGAMAAAAVDVLGNTAHWAEMSEAGVAHARRFTWDACATRHAEIFRETADTGRAIRS